MKKATALLVVLSALGLLGWQVYKKATAPKQAAGRKGRAATVAVEVAPVERGAIQDVETFTGSLRPRSQFVVAAKIAGRLLKLHVDVASPVHRDQLIAELDADEYAREVERATAEWQVAKSGAEQIQLSAKLDDQERIQQVAQAAAELGIAKANVEDTRSTLEVSQRELERVKALHERKIVSASELDAADARYKAAKAKHEVALATITQKEAALKTAQVRVSETQKSAHDAEYQVALSLATQKQAAMDAAKVRLSYTQIKAPMWEDPKAVQVVGERFVDEGAMLKANDPIVSVLDIDVLKAVVHVTERDYPKLREGQSVTVMTDAYPERPFPGRIIHVAPMLREASRQASVEVEVPNPERLLKPGMFIRARIVFGEHKDVTLVPVAALVRRNGQQGVFVADEKALQAHFVPVTVRIVQGDRAEIADPPKPLEGARVVTLGHHLLEDNTAITLPDTKAEAEAGAAGGPETRPAPATTNRSESK